MPLLWRLALPADLPAILAVAAAVHPTFPEDATVFAERLALYQAGCLVLADADADVVLGYVVSHPWIHLTPPPLNRSLGQIPPAPTTYYLHDLALLPEARGRGAAADGVRRILDHAAITNLPNASLVAVHDAGPFWARFGFSAVAPAAVPGLAEKLASYGEAACLMVKDLR